MASELYIFDGYAPNVGTSGENEDSIYVHKRQAGRVGESRI